MSRAESLIRTEIYANRSVEEELRDEFDRRVPGLAYSLFEDVKGMGRSGVREGSAVWPELNVLYVLYGDREKARLVAEAVAAVKALFPREGIKMFQYELNALPGIPDA